MAVRTVLVRLRGDSKDLESAFRRASAGAKGLTKELDTSNDRTAILVQSLLAIGPALVPLGAQAVPIVAGLTTQLTFAAGAAATTALAFSGIGDSLKAVNDYQLDPTEANLAKMTEEMGKIGPAGRDFVVFLQELRPQLQGLQDVAQAGMLPGVQEGIDELLDVLPQAERIVGNIAATLGDMSARAGADLAGEEWAEFFDYLETEAQPVLSDMLSTFGNFAQGFADMIVAFDPLAQDFSDSMLGISRDFAAWAAQLDESEGFANFVDYIQDIGPQVWATLGALTTALIELTKAAAPVGDHVLVVIEALATGLAAIAASPVGPILIGAAAGLSAVSRAIALYNLVNGSALMSLLGRGKTDGAKAGLGFRRAAGGIAALGLAFTDVDDKAGLSNTLMLGLAGTMAGPWGAAAGTAIGATMDLAAANDGFTEALERAQEALADTTTPIEQQREAVQAAREEFEAYQDDVDNDTFWEGLANQFDPAAIKNAAEGWFGTSEVDEQAAALEDLEVALQAAEEQAALSGGSQVGFKSSLDGTTLSATTAEEAIAEATAAMEENADAAIAAIDAEYAYAASLLAVDERLAKRKELQGDLAEAQRDLAAAETPEERKAAREAIAAIREELEAYKLTLDKTTEAGQENWQLLRDQAATWNDLTPDAQNARGAFKEAKEELFRTARQFGATKKEARQYVRELLEIPPKRVTAVTVDTGAARNDIDDFIADNSKKKIRLKVVTTYTSKVAPDGRAPAEGFEFDEADGGVVSFYRQGGLKPREHHVAQHAPAGAWRVWAEPETGGESYIPHAPSKRERSLEVWRQTGRILGASFLELADGAVMMAQRQQFAQRATAVPARTGGTGVSVAALAGLESAVQRLSARPVAPIMDNVTFRHNDMRETERWARSRSVHEGGGGVSF